MKTPIIAGAMAVLGINFAGFANAATGAPSILESGGAAHSQSETIDMNRSDAGSYARYLMLNGKSRQDAIELARNTDSPSSTRVAEQSTWIDAESSGVGSYARYLMLNGKSHEDALQMARNVDHPTTSHYAIHREVEVPAAETSQR